MKKTYSLVHPKIKAARIVDSIKHDIKKFQSNARKQDLPSGASYWSFDCKFGYSEEAAAAVHPGELKKCIDEAASANSEAIYIEVVSKPVFANQEDEQY
ncbi:DUF6172 family protein [Agaribacterium sp. ZY112]|uniref:DUF6172 family protein n=1 Tax=Agaribacterium sp. ZY112 TaxID=3233574 RepID=UPI0035259996